MTSLPPSPPPISRPPERCTRLPATACTSTHSYMDFASLCRVADISGALRVHCGCVCSLHFVRSVSQIIPCACIGSVAIKVKSYCSTSALENTARSSYIVTVILLRIYHCLAQHFVVCAIRPSVCLTEFDFEENCKHTVRSSARRHISHYLDYMSVKYVLTTRTFLSHIT